MSTLEQRAFNSNNTPRLRARVKEKEKKKKEQKKKEKEKKEISAPLPDWTVTGSWCKHRSLDPLPESFNIVYNDEASEKHS